MTRVPGVSQACFELFSFSFAHRFPLMSKFYMCFKGQLNTCVPFLWLSQQITSVWLKTTEVYSLTVLEARAEVTVSAGLRSLQRLQGRILPHLFRFLEALSVPWLVASGCTLCLCLHVAFSFGCFCLFCFLQGSSSLDLGTTQVIWDDIISKFL